MKTNLSYLQNAVRAAEEYGMRDVYLTDSGITLGAKLGGVPVEAHMELSLATGKITVFFANISGGQWMVKGDHEAMIAAGGPGPYAHQLFLDNTTPDGKPKHLKKVKA